MLELKDVNKKFGNHIVLNHVSLSVEKGDVVAILGPSGSGKTTLLRCAGYLTKADSGTLILGDKQYDLSRIKGKELLEYRSKVGFVFQNFNLYGNKTALQNVTLGLQVARRMKKEDAQQIGKALLKRVGMEDRMDYYPSKLSGGQQQRVAIARALATSPEVVFFDEPTSALDPELTGEVLNVIRQLTDDGMTMIVVTHEMEFARKVATKVVFIENGEIVEENNSKDFFERPQMERTKEFVYKSSTWISDQRSGI